MKNNPKSYSVKMYAEMKLDDGRVIATEDEQFMIGSKVFAIDDDGNAEPLSAGSYTMENGEKMTIGDSSEILDLGEDKQAEGDVKPEEEEEMAKEETIDEVKEEMSEETEEPVMMSSEFASELMTQIEDLKSKIVELSEQPAVDNIKYNPEGNTSNETIDLTKLSAQERAAYYINNLK